MRQRLSAIAQGFRTRDAAFRIFRNEKLECYECLFNLAAQYACLAVKSFDYKTGLLNTSEGRMFLNQIVSARFGSVRRGRAIVCRMRMRTARGRAIWTSIL
ncbi:MAG: hypothetical protein M2R45_02177 [Verrucomicrobia subdivision 3 bacterium]|nr:hypothetical protein [Limisphaerales bacterium]MCS1413753.1 hypothetical protein [Limisphaerales bacterium]